MTPNRLSNPLLLSLALATVLGVSAGVLVGCGGGAGGGTSVAARATGKATLKITWPTSSAKLIPVDSSSITVQFLSGTTVVATQTVAKPTSGSTTTVSFTSLPAGRLTLVSTAYPMSTGTGTAQATASQTVTITAGNTVALAITMASTIASLTVSPSTVSVAAGSTTTVTATPVDSSGATVLVGTSTLTFASSNTSVATVNATTGVVTGVAAGTATITATESESGKTGTSAVTVASSSGTSPVDLFNAYYNTLTSTEQGVTEPGATATYAAKWCNLPATPASDGTNSLRNGVSYSYLTSTQQTAWTNLVSTVLSGQPLTQEQQIRAADTYLGTLNNGYSGDFQYVASVGTPSTSGYWLLQIGGHHNAYNLTYNGTTIVSTTPYFLGVEPTSFTSNGTTVTALGTSTTGQEGAMLSLVNSLTTSQAPSANLNTSANGNQTFSDVYLGYTHNDRSYFPTSNRGILASSLTSAQQALVLAAIEQWTKNSPIASTYNTLYQSELANTYVAYSDATSNSTPSTITFGSQGDYVRIDGPHVWIEFICQNGVVIQNQIHFHSVWRDRLTDYAAQYFN